MEILVFSMQPRAALEAVRRKRETRGCVTAPSLIARVSERPRTGSLSNVISKQRGIDTRFDLDTPESINVKKGSLGLPYIVVVLVAYVLSEVDRTSGGQRT